MSRKQKKDNVLRYLKKDPAPVSFTLGRSQGFGLYDISHLCAGVGAWGREWECEDGICYNIVDKNKIEDCKISYPEFYNNYFFSSRENVNFPAFNDGK